MTQKKLDQKVCDEVNAMVQNSESLSENQLKLLDKRLSALVTQHRGTTTEEKDKTKKEPKTDEISIISKHSKTQSLMPPTHFDQQSNATDERKEIERRILSLTEGKGIGMTEDQWNNIVIENAKNF